MRAPCSLIAILLLSGCYYSSHVDPDAAQRTNASLERIEAGTSTNPDYPHDRVVRLWSDKPDYVALSGATHVREMRVISAVPPYYPYLLHLAHVEADVIVSFVVGADGKVEDARVIESSDARFNSSCIDAIRQFTWLPAQGATGPEPAMALLPFHFRDLKKAAQSTDAKGPGKQD